MVDRPRLDQLLVLLAGYVRILRQLATTPLPEFVEDPPNYGSAERFLQLAIETTLSIGDSPNVSSPTPTGPDRRG